MIIIFEVFNGEVVLSKKNGEVVNLNKFLYFCNKILKRWHLDVRVCSRTQTTTCTHSLIQWNGILNPFSCNPNTENNHVVFNFEICYFLCFHSPIFALLVSWMMQLVCSIKWHRRTSTPMCIPLIYWLMHFVRKERWKKLKWSYTPMYKSMSVLCSLYASIH